MLYLLDLIGFDSNGLLSRVLSAQRPRWRRSMVDEILLQLDKTEMFTIHLQRIGRKHQPFRDQGGMQQTLCAVTRSRTIGQLPEGQGRCLIWRLLLTIINIYEIVNCFLLLCNIQWNEWNIVCLLTFVFNVHLDLAI